MLRTPENLRAVLDFLVSKPDLTAAAHSIGAGRTSKLLFDWIARSNRGDPEFLIDWPEGEEPRQFCQQILVARKRYVVLFEHKLRDAVLSGIPRTQVKDGQIVYRLDPRFVGWSDEEMIALGFGVHERYLRNERGEAIELVLNEPCPAHLAIHVSKGLMPALYGDRLAINATVRTPSVMHPGDSKRVKQIEHEATPMKQIGSIEPMPAHVTPDEWNKYQPHPDDKPGIADMKRQMRHKLSRPPSLNDPRVVTDARTGARSIAQVPIGRDNPDDPPELIGNAPADAPLPRRAEPAPARSEDHYGKGVDPARLPGVTPDGKPTVSVGARVV